MKQMIIKKIITYSVLYIIATMIFAALSGDSENVMGNIVGNIVFYLTIIAILFDIGWSINNKKARKKYIRPFH
ncbi:MAG: hypothetical protein LBD23_07760 [Oscillospiraceae bacterium]|jgi:hypothetical protein|nr:hypothetical protein [Oscillospiraceae bacterium]